MDCRYSSSRSYRDKVSSPLSLLLFFLMIRPPPRSPLFPYTPLFRSPGALLNAVATSFIDEAASRGILLAFLVGAGLPPLVAITGQALAYALATRGGRPAPTRKAKIGRAHV